MYPKKNIKLKGLVFILSLTLLVSNQAFCDEKNYEIDTIRTQLGCIKDKNSPDYTKTKQKLDKLISKSKINYTDSARLYDVQRLIQEQKYNAAIYELNDLIENGYEISKCNELLGDIGVICGYLPKKIAQYYKLAIQYDKYNISAIYKLAKVYLKEKKNIIAIEYLKQAIDITDDFTALHEIKKLILNNITPQNKYEANNLYEALGDINLKLNKKNETYEAYYKALQINPNDIYLKYHLSNLLYDDNQNQAAIALYNSILTENKKDSQIKISKAKTYEKEGNLLSAYNVYCEILRDYPNSTQAKLGIYNIYKEKITPSEILKKVYSNNPNYKPTIDELRNFAKFLNKEGYELGSQDFNNFALKLEEAQKRELIAKQETKQLEFLKEEKKSQEAKSQTKKEVKKETQKPQKQKAKNIKKITKNETQIKKKTPNKIEQKKDNIIKKAPDKKNQPQKEDLNIKQKEIEQKAIENERKKAIQKDAKKYYELKAQVDKYLLQEPKTAQDYIAIANTYKQMGEITNALKYYKEALKLQPTNSDIYYNIGLTYFEQNSPQSAKTNLTKSINLDNNNTKAVNLLAFVNQTIVTKILNKSYELYEKKDYISAFENLDEGIKEYPNNSQLHYYRALIYIAMNRNAAAIIDLQKAIELDGSHFMAYYQLGQVYEKIKDERSALVAYEKFLSIEPDEKDLVNQVQQKVITLGAKYY